MMPYRICTNQNGVPAGKVRFSFDCYVNGRRYQKNIVSQKSVVKDFYQQWENEITNREIFGEFHFFEVFKNYLDLEY